MSFRGFSKKITRRDFFYLGGNLLLFLALISTVFISQQPTHLGSEAQILGKTYYVSKNGNNQDGQSWTTAWTELGGIDWSLIQPGDTIFIDGGETEMVYLTTLNPAKNGTATHPITVKLSSEAGRNGKAVIFGGRSTPLPECGQSVYNYQTTNVLSAGIDLRDSSWLVIDGGHWRGIAIYGVNGQGIKLSSSSSDLTVRNVEVHDTGTAYQSGGVWYPDQKGVALSGLNVTFERAIIHDNGQDAFQSGGGISNFTLRESWLYNSRLKSDGSFWNYCRHSDGIQVYGGGDQYGVTIENSVLGPGFMQGVLLGAPLHNDPSGNPRYATFHQVRVKGSLFYGNGNINVSANVNPHTKPTGWSIERVTSDRPTDQRWHNVHFEGDGGEISLRDSIFTGGLSLTVPSQGDYSGNFQYWLTYGPTVGLVADPVYQQEGVHGSISTAADFSLSPSSPAVGKGALVTSAAALLGLSEPPPPSPDLFPINQYFEAEQGVINLPFQIVDGKVFQTGETVVPSEGGRASYRFNVSTPGAYLVKAWVEAPSEGSNSFFVNIGAEPSSPEAIFDIPITLGSEERTVSWRGNGTPSLNQYVPKVFFLSGGEHELILRGREANVRIDKIKVESVITDLNQDGRVDSFDALALFRNWFTLRDNSLADIDQNQRVNGLDFSYLIRDW